MQLPKAHLLSVFLRDTLRLHWKRTKLYICQGQRSTMVVTWRLLSNRCYFSPESCVCRALSRFKRRCAFQDPFAEKTSIAVRSNLSLGGGNIRTAATISRLRRFCNDLDSLHRTHFLLGKKHNRHQRECCRYIPDTVPPTVFWLHC